MRDETTPSLVQTPHGTPQAIRAEHLLAVRAFVRLDLRAERGATDVTTAGHGPRLRRPNDETTVAFEGFGAGTFELDDQIAEEVRMPVVAVGGEEAVGFLVGEEIEDQGVQGCRVTLVVGVENPRVRGRGDGVCDFRQACDGRENVVAERRREQAVREEVEIDEQEVFRAALRVAQIAVEVGVELCWIWERERGAQSDGHVVRASGWVGGRFGGAWLGG